MDEPNLARRSNSQTLLALGVMLGFVLSLSAFAPTAWAAPWSIMPGIIPEASMAQLRVRYPAIDTAADVESLLQDIGRRHPVLRLEASFVDGAWIVSGEKARLVGSVDFGLTTRILRSPLQAVAQNYDGQVDSPETRTKLTEAVASYLQKRGYFASRVKLVVDAEDEDFVVYTFNVNEGEPCIIDNIELAFALPDGVRFGVRPGDICDDEEVSMAVDRLAQDIRDKGYNQSRIELAGMTRNQATNTATVHIAGTVGSRVRYQINDPTKRLLIDDIFAKDELSGIDPTIVGPDAMAAELSRRFRNRGYSYVQITGPKIDRSKGDEIVYTFDVEPGPQYILRSIQFEGATMFKDSELMETMGLAAFWQTAPPLNPDEIRSGIERLRAKYQAVGFWDVQIRERTPSKDKDTATAQLVIRIEEGGQRRLRQVIVQGNAAVPTSEVRSLLAVKDGSSLDRSAVLDFQQSLRTRYVREGYLYADITIDLQASESRHSVPITLIATVKEGRRVKIGAITIVGLTRTRPKVVARELLFETGDWYDPERINLSRRALTNLGLFRSVQINPADRNALNEQLDELDWIVDVREGKPGNVSFGPGWSLADGWRYSSEASYNNIGGVGRQVSMRGGFSEEKRQVAIGSKTLIGRSVGAGFVEPYIGNLPVDAKISTNHTARATEETWKLSRKGEVAFEHRLKHWLPGSTVALFYGQQVTREESATTFRDALLTDDVRVGRVGIRANIDDRDDLVFPTKGYTFSPEVSWARYGLGGDLRYFRWDFVAGRYLAITPRWVVALGVQLTSFEDVERKGTDRDLDVLPHSERVVAGGADSVRGYGEGALGPLIRSPKLDDNNIWDCTYDLDRAGGTRLTVLKLELRHRFSEGIAMTGFVDSGNAFFSDDEVAKFRRAFDQNVTPTAQSSACEGNAARRTVEDNVGYRYDELVKNPGYVWSRHFVSYGLGVNFLTAIGAINVAYGLPWKEPKSEKCKEDSEYCYARGKTGDPYIARGELHLNVSTRF